jgi:hypothetical protein
MCSWRVVLECRRDERYSARLRVLYGDDSSPGGPKVRRGDFQKPANFKGFLVPVLVPVCTVIWCDLVQFDAKLEDFPSQPKRMIYAAPN